MRMDWTIVLLIWAACAVLALIIGAKKGNPVAALFVGIVFGPLGLLVAVVSGNADRWPCPSCAERVMREAKVCPHCRAELTGLRRPSDVTALEVSAYLTCAGGVMLMLTMCATRGS